MPPYEPIPAQFLKCGLLIVFAVMFVLILSGCVPTTSLSVDDGKLKFCDGAKPIGWSQMDTDGTIEAVKEHNAVGKALCGWGKGDPK